MIFDYRFYIIKQTRGNFEDLISSLSNEELNKIPEGFKNNIIWNFGHAIATQQLLTYGLSSLPLIVNEEFLNDFRKGSLPTKTYDVDDVKSILEISQITMESVERDFKEDRFMNFKNYITSFGVELKSVDDALSFLPVHEGLHLGYAMAIRKAF